MSEKFRFGVIGMGIGRVWAREIAGMAECELTALYDPFFEQQDESRRKEVAAFNPNIVHSYDEFFATKPQIVVVASPDQCHCEGVLLALDHGCDVICEKPLAPTVEDCQRMVEAVKKSGRRFMTGQICRFTPGFMLAKQLIEEGRIGEIACIESEYAHNYRLGAAGFQNWRRDAKVARENIVGGGCHAMDLLRWIMGEPTSVYAVSNHMLMPDWCQTDDSCYAVLRFKNGAIGKIFASCGVNMPYSMRTVIHGTKGSIVCDNTRDHIDISEFPLRRSSGMLGLGTIPVSKASHNVLGELKDFLSHVKDGTPIPTDVYEGSRTVALGDAIMRSARTGQVTTPVVFER